MDKYGDLRRKNARLLSSYTASLYDLRLAPFLSVYDGISTYSITKIYDRNAGSCNTAEYGRIRTASGMYTTVNDRIRNP